MPLKLFMCLIGCDAPGRNIEQHDVFFGIGHELKDLAPQIKSFWPEAIKPHFDAWREVTSVDGFSITVHERNADPESPLPLNSSLLPITSRLFFLNLGGYKKDEFEEFHYRMIAVASDKGEAIRKAKETAFFRHTGFQGATSHVDDKYGVDVDDVVEIKDILPRELVSRYSILIEPAGNVHADPVNLGFYLIDKF